MAEYIFFALITVGLFALGEILLLDEKSSKRNVCLLGLAALIAVGILSHYQPKEWLHEPTVSTNMTVRTPP